MVSETVRSDPGRLAPLAWADSARDDTLADELHHLLVLRMPELERVLRSRIQAEDALPEDARHAAVLARLRAWLRLDREDARVIAGAWDAALETFPSGYAARCIDVERAVMLNGMGRSEFQALSDFVPWLTGRRGLEVFAGALAGPPAG